MKGKLLQKLHFIIQFLLKKNAISYICLDETTKNCCFIIQHLIFPSLIFNIWKKMYDSIQFHRIKSCFLSQIGTLLFFLFIFGFSLQFYSTASDMTNGNLVFNMSINFSWCNDDFCILSWLGSDKIASNNK